MSKIVFGYSPLKLLTIFLLINFYFCYSEAQEASENNDCGVPSYIPYVNEEYCFKVHAESHVSHSDALALCLEDSPESSPLTILNAGEQHYFQDVLAHQLGEHIWLGARSKRIRGKFHYTWALENQEEMKYTNWAPGHPLNNSFASSLCVQMIHSAGPDLGKWQSVPCTRKASVICEKDAELSLASIKRRLDRDEESLVPKGFVYMQLPDKEEPSQIWPRFVWKDITEQYAGLFFRALGGKSGGFEEEQKENIPRITELYRMYPREHNLNAGIAKFDLELAEGEENYWILEVGDYYTGNGDYYDNGTLKYFYSYDGYTYYEPPPAPYDNSPSYNAPQGQQVTTKYSYTKEYLGITIVGGEVRPRNMAVRFWERM